MKKKKKEILSNHFIQKHVKHNMPESVIISKISQTIERIIMSHGKRQQNRLETITKNKTAVDIGGRLSAKPGKAQILTCLDGDEIKAYDIEIIKTNFQSACNEKSMVLRVTDKNLIAKTGGIVQGMSGSPIIQDGKLIGAVTHVFVNDATKGFGIYIDWMLEQ